MIEVEVHIDIEVKVIEHILHGGHPMWINDCSSIKIGIAERQSVSPIAKGLLFFVFDILVRFDFFMRIGYNLDRLILFSFNFSIFFESNSGSDGMSCWKIGVIKFSRYF